MDTVTTTDTGTVRDHAPALAWLTQRPNLPMPRGVTLSGAWGSEPNIIVDLTTAEQVQAWADAMGADMGTSEYKGKVHYRACAFDPFYISATAIVDPAER